MKSKKSKGQQSKWEWYGVKLIFECIISGNPAPETVDKNFSDNHKTFEESIIIVRAQSFDHAYKLAEKKAKEMELDYFNPYNQKVKWLFLEAIHCFNMFDPPIHGTEVYSRHVRIPKSVTTEQFLDNFYPETIPVKDDEPDFDFILRIKEFNARLNNK